MGCLFFLAYHFHSSHHLFLFFSFLLMLIRQQQRIFFLYLVKLVLAETKGLGSSRALGLGRTGPQDNAAAKEVGKGGRNDGMVAISV
jgi:hypothetical protein